MCGVSDGFLFCGVILEIVLRKGELVAMLKKCCGCQCSVSIPHGAMVWSVICDCGISW